VDYAQMKKEKDERYEAHCEEYADQLQLQGYISSLEKDNESIMETIKSASKGRVIRHNKKLIKINDKDIKRYKKALSAMPPVPEFK